MDRGFRHTMLYFLDQYHQGHQENPELSKHIEEHQWRFFVKICCCNHLVQRLLIQISILLLSFLLLRFFVILFSRVRTSVDFGNYHFPIYFSDSWSHHHSGFLKKLKDETNDKLICARCFDLMFFKYKVRFEYQAHFLEQQQSHRWPVR